VAPFGGGLETSGAIAEVREKFAGSGFRKSRAMKSQTGEPDIMPPRVGAKQVARGTLVRPASANSGGALLQILCCLSTTGLYLSAAQARSPLHLDAIRRDGYGVVELKQPTPNEFFAEGAINGHGVRLILDTGFCSDHIMMANTSARLLRTAPKPIKGNAHGVTGKVIDHLSKGTADSLVLGNVQVSGTTLYFGSFGFLNARQDGGLWYTDGMLGNERAVRRDADGFLGLGFLQTCAAIIDLSNRRLYLKPPRTGRTPQLGPVLKSVGFSEAPFELKNVGLLVDAEINGTQGKMIIDTGAYLSVVDNRFAAQAKLNKYQATNVRMIDATGAEMRPDWADPSSFKIGGVETYHPKLQVEPMSFYLPTGGRVIGLLGMDFLGQSWSIIDFGRQKLYFSATR
jgi:predicted aspartyl protease